MICIVLLYELMHFIANSSDYKIMSKHVHPLQQQYNKKVAVILSKHNEQEISVNNFVSLLSQNQIKFFSRDDVTKFTKLSNPFDNLNIREAFTYLEFIYVIISLQIKFFIVKFSGRSFKTLNIKPVQIKRNSQMHTVDLCVTDFKKKMEKLHGKQNFWFRALGGVSGCNFIKRQIFQKRVNKIFANTCHSVCTGQFMRFIIQENPQGGDIQWQNFKNKINDNYMKGQTQNLQNNEEQIKIAIHLDRPTKVNQKSLKITTTTNSENNHKLLSMSQSVKKVDEWAHFQNQKAHDGRRRLKTLAQKVKMEIQSNNWKLPQLKGIQHSIHSKIKYDVGSRKNSTIKKCKSSLNNY